MDDLSRSPQAGQARLHPQLQAALDRAVRYPPMHEVPLERLRETATARFAGRLPKPEVASIEDIVVPGAGHGIPVRVYHPKPDQILPLVVFFHGGSFVMCDLETYDPLCRRISILSHCVVASVDYRLAPEHPFPSAPDDCLAATRWLAENAGLLGADPRRIALAGDSAGGNLATVTCIAFRTIDSRLIKAQLLFYPVTDSPDETRPSYRENRAGKGLDAEVMQRFWPQYYTGADSPPDPRAAPLHEPSLGGLPATCILTAHHDILRDEGEAYAERLVRAGVRTVTRRYPDMNHGFLFAAGAVDAATAALAESCEWLSSTLAGAHAA